MDDYDVNMLSEAKNEYCVRLVNILTPLIMQGVHSIFDEALVLCESNDEDDKYLMTFQNFLTRVPKWNQSLMTEETNRIKKESSCSYLDDLITCVHISHLKLLTSIRVSQKQKKLILIYQKWTNSSIRFILHTREKYIKMYIYLKKTICLFKDKKI